MTLLRDEVRRILERFQRQRILVVGDLMLDRYIHGSVSRISPEAPVPVVHVRKEKSVPGGASNVAANVRALGGRAGVSGVLGRDLAGAELKQHLREAGVSVRGVVALKSIPTIVKTRIIAERQQVVRIDWEDRFDFTAAELKEFCRRLDREIAVSTGVILEDYGKGVIRQEVVDAVLKAARKYGVPTGLDPKDNEALRLEGITLATPNRKEAFIAAGMEETTPDENPLQDRALLKVGRLLLRKWKPGLLAITLGPQGMILIGRDRPPKHVPTVAREVFDVSGAGDTVIATSLLAIAAGADHEQAAEIANYAAGVVVGKLGTATCTQEELLGYIGSFG